MLKKMRPEYFHGKIENKICVIRGKNVVLDKDLAAIYGVTTKVLSQAVRRNLERFPEDFMFQLTVDEMRSIPGSKSQIAALNSGYNITFKSYVFTENGIAMLSSVLNSSTAIQVNIQIMRASPKDDWSDKPRI